MHCAGEILNLTLQAHCALLGFYLYYQDESLNGEYLIGYGSNFIVCLQCKDFLSSGFPLSIETVEFYGPSVGKNGME